MTVYSFKHVGKTTQDLELEPTGSAQPIGIKTPLQLGSTEGFFAMHFTVADQLHDNLRNLILTNWGERPALYDYGANLRPLMTELVTEDDFATSAITKIKNAVSRWMPYVDLKTFEAVSDFSQSKSLAIKRITVVYDIPALNVTDKALQVLLYAV